MMFRSIFFCFFLFFRTKWPKTAKGDPKRQKRGSVKEENHKRTFQNKNQQHEKKKEQKKRLKQQQRRLKIIKIYTNFQDFYLRVIIHSNGTHAYLL